MLEHQHRHDTQKPALSNPQLYFNTKLEPESFAAPFRPITIRHPLFALALIAVALLCPQAHPFAKAKKIMYQRFPNK